MYIISSGHISNKKNIKGNERRGTEADQDGGDEVRDAIGALIIRLPLAPESAGLSETGID